MKVRIRVYSVLAILVAGFASFGASVLVASPWGAAAAHGAKVKRLAAEQHISPDEALRRLGEKSAADAEVPGE
jgi:hypothetical protein